MNKKSCMHSEHNLYKESDNNTKEKIIDRISYKHELFSIKLSSSTIVKYNLTPTHSTCT